MRNESGFTLLELLIVVAILAILALIAIPAYFHLTDDAKEVAYDAQVKILKQAAIMYLLDGGVDTTWRASAGDLPWPGSDEPRDAWGEYMEDGRWPANPMGNGDFVVEITGGRITITPGRGG